MTPDPQQLRHERLLKRARSRRGRDKAARRDRSELDEQDDERALAALKPLAAWFQEGGPLEHFLLGERLLEVVPADRLQALETEGDALVRLWTHIAPRLTDARYRREWRDFVVRIEDELGAGAPPDHPDKAALEEARFWIGDRLVTGPASLENVFLRQLFELTCEQGALAGWLPGWLIEALEFTDEWIEQEQRQRREERALLRIAHGPLTVTLPRALTPTIDAALERLLSEELDPDALGDTAWEACERDLRGEARSQVALRFREAAEQARLQQHPFTAFDLGAIFELLAEDGPASDRAAWLLYVRAIDAHLAHEKHRVW